MASVLSPRNLYVLALVAGVLAFDQLTKRVVTQTLALGESWPAEGFFRITRVANTGSAFGLFGGHNMPLTLASILGVAVILWFMRSSGESLVVRTSLG
ncbi:MAG: signal peptidase II, partial [Chloroflexota bacterium]|nr:signal peptidase II [Chloroflexota bacterium]